jgi:hypothetical protein
MQKIEYPGLEPNEIIIDDEGIIVFKVHDTYTGERNRIGDEASLKAIAIMRAQHKPAVMLADLSDLKGITPDGRKGAYEGIQVLRLDRVAYAGGPQTWWLKNLMSISLALLSRDKYRYFPKVEDARQWLLEYKLPANRRNN